MMNTIVPWTKPCALVPPKYAKGAGAQPPIEFEHMLRIHFIQHRFNGCSRGTANSVGVKPGEAIATNDNGPVGAVACGVTWGG